ncbi:PTS transporter subunit EIIC [Pseudobutyrivibrio sp.]|uniref:PTS transporter subunit EIIC n=1 Tax=Pseudobutyrivibrio sp. TaxID=2014367 RepID=UPI001D3DD05D|nr:PTS transporter subunit EIIC [Pseudobutyrivibrio sp.]MBE5910094.1 PTS beta-glucoside transporter subunit IIABC [Pseudobutyrivibrio sp.]
MADISKYQQLSDEIINLVGGKENIKQFMHCVTRLRFQLADKDKVNNEAVKAIPGVIGTNWSGEQFQVIIGPVVGEVYKKICSENNLEAESPIDEAVEQDVAEKKKKKFGDYVSAVLSGIAGCVIPLLPLLIGAGLLKVFITIFTNLNIVPADNSTIVVFNFVADAAFYFLPVFVGATAARKFGANMSLGMLLGAALISPTFIELVGAGEKLTIFNLPIHGASYSSTIFPVICSVYLMSYVEKFVAKKSPESLRNILEPLITLVVMIPVTFVVIAPLGAILGDGLATILNEMYIRFGWVAIAIQAAIYPFMVLTGMHVGLIPIGINNIMTLGYEPSAILVGVSNLNQGMACFGVACRTKDKNLRSTAISSGITAVFGGVTEPAFFGVNLAYKTPLYASMIGSLIGGAIAGILHVYSYSFGSSAFPFLLFCYISPEGRGLIETLVSLLVGMIITFIATLFLYKDKNKE